MDLLEHDAKRKVEVELAMLREDLEEGGGYTEEQIEEKISKKRKELMKGMKIVLDADSKDTHQLAAAKDAELDKMAAALGVAKGGKVGESFNRDLQEAKKQDRIRARE